jgi:patatin-like phospholipase/acyl hydrolase
MTITIKIFYSLIHFKNLLICSFFIISSIQLSLAETTLETGKQTTRKHVILSIDGGGVRGVIPARILQEIEQRIKLPIYEVVDTISGNSTGGIIALGLVTPDETGTKAKYRAEDLVTLYRERSRDIFSKSLWHRVKTGFGTWGTKYEREALDKILDEKFGFNTLSNTLKNTLIFSYSLDFREGHLWSSAIAKTQPKKDFYLKDIAAATSAAPTYFAPARISNTQGNYCYKLINEAKQEVIVPTCIEADGGIFANNPAIMTVAFLLEQDPTLDRENLILISLGTGQVRRKSDQISLHQGGILNWLIDANVIDLILNATAEVSEWTATALGIPTYRIQVFLDPKEEGLDNVTPHNINSLLDKTEDYIKNNNDHINKICELLLNNRKM